MTHPPPNDTFDDDSAYFIGQFDGNVTLLSESGGNVSFNSSDFTESENVINEFTLDTEQLIIIIIRDCHMLGKPSDVTTKSYKPLLFQGYPVTT